MSIFKSRMSKADRENTQLITRLDGRSVKYVARRDTGDSVESVIGKTGRINTRNGSITIVCDGREVFRCNADDAQCGELLSLDGVVIRGIDVDTGRPSIVVAYYQYYR